MDGVTIDRLGVIHRRHNALFPKLRVKPLVLLAVLAINSVLLVTNPANDVVVGGDYDYYWNVIQNTVDGWRSGTISSSSSSGGDRGKDKSGERKRLLSLDLSFLGLELDVFESSSTSSRTARPKKDSGALPNHHVRNRRHKNLTNFFVFSLSKSRDGVFLHTLRSEWKLCPRNDQDSSDLEDYVCDWIADKMCHRMTMFDPRYRPFTAYRIVLGTLLVSTLLHCCFYYGATTNEARIRRNNHNPVLALLLSRPRLSDYVYTNVYLYPFLQMLERVTKNTSSSVFYYAHVAMLFVIGAACHELVELFVRKRGSRSSRSGGNVRMAVYSAALGYMLAVSKIRPLLEFANLFRLGGNNNNNGMLTTIDFDPSTVLTSYTILGVADLLFGNGSIATFTELLLWLVGGSVGHCVGDYHLDRYGWQPQQLRWREFFLRP